MSAFKSRSGMWTVCKIYTFSSSGSSQPPLFPATSIKTLPSALHLPAHLMTRFNHPVLVHRDKPVWLTPSLRLLHREPQYQGEREKLSIQEAKRKETQRMERESSSAPVTPRPISSYNYLPKENQRDVFRDESCTAVNDCFTKHLNQNYLYFKVLKMCCISQITQNLHSV